MAEIISVMNQKGCVAKTTTVINLGSYFAMKNKKILLVDADAQGSLSKHFKMDNADTSINELFLKQKFEITKISKNLDLLPSDENFVGMEMKIINEFSREQILKKALDDISDEYDFIIIDCPSNVSYITINAITASDYVIIPVTADKFGLDGIELMTNFIKTIKTNLNEDLLLLGVLLTSYEERLTSSKDVNKIIEEKSWNNAFFTSRIRKNSAIKNSQLESKSIFEYDMNCNASKDYTSLGKEILKKIK